VSPSSFSAFRPREDAAGRSPAPSPPALLAPGAGEPLLTDGQKIALLKMRRSDWSKAILTKLKEIDQCAVTGADFRSLVPLHLAISKGSFHVLTSSGRWRADQTAREIARANSLHVIAYDFGSYSRAAFWHCTCGERSYHSRNTPGNYAGKLVKGGRLHLEHVGAIPKRDVA
jgi:hypothetical protein